MSMTKLYEWESVRVPESCEGVDIVIGIDEAGRGPVLGPLVYTAAFWPVSEDAEIQRAGFNDSKQLKEGERQRLLDKMRNHPSIGWVIEEISAESISEQMQRSHPISLNALSYDAVIRALRAIVQRPRAPKVTTIYVDTVGDPDYYKSVLQRALGDDFGEFVIEKKADAKFKTVSAASIIAKVTRDTVLSRWQWHEPALSFDKSFGSGYPGDEHCSKWLKRSVDPVFGFPDLVRFSWSTCAEVLKTCDAVPMKWECDDEDTHDSHSMLDFFGGGGAASKCKKPRTAFFAKRKLTRLTVKDIV